MSTQNYLPDNVQQLLRERGTISSQEVVLRQGDVFIAVNVVNESRRIIDVDRSLLEGKSKSRLLKG